MGKKRGEKPVKISDDDLREVSQGERKNYTYSVETKIDKMMAVLSCESIENEEGHKRAIAITVPDVLSIIEEAGIRYGTDIDRISDRLSGAKNQRNKTVIKRLLVSEG